jgi:hypothetical protein
MDFWTDIAFTVLLRVLKDKKQSQQLRKALLKVFKAILVQFGSDPEFEAAIPPWFGPSDKQ